VRAARKFGKYAAMEEEQFDVLPSPTYVRGFLRTYGEFLGLDGSLLVDEYESRFLRPEDRNSDRLPAHSGARHPAAARRRRKRGKRRTEPSCCGWRSAGDGIMLLVWLGAATVSSSTPQLRPGCHRAGDAVHAGSRAGDPEPLNPSRSN